MQSLNFLGISGSLRRRSANRGLLQAAQASLPQGCHLEIADLSEIPLYNPDLADKPAAVDQVLHQIDQADALVLACPEYNFSLAPALKNVLDWASRAPDNRLLSGKPVAIMGAGGGMGTSRAQYHLRQVCVYLNLHPLNKPEICVNAFTGTFDAEFRLIDEKFLSLIAEQMRALKEFTLRLSGPAGD